MTEPQPSAPSWAPTHLARWFAALVFAILIGLAAYTGRLDIALAYLDDFAAAIPTEPAPVSAPPEPVIGPTLPQSDSDSDAPTLDSEAVPA